MGDPTTPEGQALIKERSPLFAADKISRPLLIGQGANDPRVNIAESQQIVDAMKAKGIPVTYVVFPDEGHGFARPVNNIAFNAIAENFLASCLGGRAEPIGDAVKASTAQVKHGAEFAPGLKEAVEGTRSPSTSLYERLGGMEAVRALVDDGVRHIAADTRINGRFTPAGHTALTKNLSDLVCQRTGGPCRYAGRDMASAHEGMNIRDDQFDALVE